MFSNRANALIELVICLGLGIPLSFFLIQMINRMDNVEDLTRVFNQSIRNERIK